MSASRSSSRRSRTVLLAVLALLAAAALALLGLYAFIRAKAGALQAGAAFTFDYTVTSTSPEPSTAYAVLDALDALTGSVTGQSSGDSLYLAWYNVGSAAFQSDQAPGPDQAFTDLYVKDGLVYLNVRQIYRTLLSGLSAQYPVITSLIPDWGLGDYITQTQLARETGILSYHLSGKRTLPSRMTFRRPGVPMGLPGFEEFELWQTDPDAVRRARQALDSL